MTTTLKLGLRFDQRQVPLLRGLAEQYRFTNMPDEWKSMFDKAVEAAEAGEPLLVLCDTPTDAHIMANVFAQHGVERPVIEEPNG